MTKSGSNPIWRILFWIFVALIFIYMMFPFYWAVASALKTERELFQTPATLWPTNPTLINFQAVLENPRFLRGLTNSLIVATTATVVSVAMSVLAAFAVVRLRFRGRIWMARLILFKYLLPTSLIYIPLFLVVNGLGLANTLQSLIFTYLSFSIPFATWLLIGYFKSIPYELEECALIDGATRLQILWKITLPLAVPGLISAGIFAFTLSWNEFIYALAFIQSAEKKTVPVAVLTQLVEGDVYHWGSLMAGALLGSIPVALFYSFFVEHYVSSLTGAVKE